MLCKPGGGAVLTIDDYSGTIKNSHPEQIYEECQRHGINARIQKYSHWIDFGVGVADNSDFSEIALTAFHDICSNSCWWLCDGRFYTCGMVKSWINAGFAEDDANNYIDIKTCSDTEFLEFQAGYTQKGYFDLCRKCRGYLTINRDKIGVAEQ